MVQAARSRKQNIREGTQASGPPRQGNTKLTNVARSSLKELVEDYRDSLRAKGHSCWDEDAKESRCVCKLAAKPGLTSEDFRAVVGSRPGPGVVNVLICLIHQANDLLDQRLRWLEREFLEEGRLGQRMSRARLAARRCLTWGSATV